MTSLESVKGEPTEEHTSSLKGWIFLLLLLLALAVTNPKEDDFANYAMKQALDGSSGSFLSEIGETVIKAATSSDDYVIFTIFTFDAVFEQKKFLGVCKIIFIPIN
jgi:hypothetical protein